MASDRPLAVLVSGAPGSGKTTLAARLGQSLSLPHVSKDLLVKGVWRTRHRASELGVAGVEIHYQVMENLLALGVSFVTDQTWIRGVSEEEVSRRLGSSALLVSVHCRALDAAARWEQRPDPLFGPKRRAKLRPQVAEYQVSLAEPLDFGGPVIRVDTSDGYTPALEEIVAEINRIHPPPLVHDLDAAPGPPGRDH